MLQAHSVECPYCGETNEIEVDPSGGRRQVYVEDCQVCCRPWRVSVKLDTDGEAWVSVATLDEVEGGD